ncbi:mitochondrial enolase superfamily member 1 [Corapipo altera]|uniref:mitochondrial enolase superfamily member 1 n=1 Tax=Corapipo altera TaxID=415028 RepID=UPI000FD6833F|nr:mitochondrial enolase superfamily member 1 [Corapipo altera]
MKESCSYLNEPTVPQVIRAEMPPTDEGGMDITVDIISQVIHNCETCTAIKQAKRVKPLWVKPTTLHCRRPAKDAKQLQFCMNFRYITVLLTEEEATEIVQNGLRGKKEMKQQIVKYGYLSYTRSCSWLGYSDQQLKPMLNAKQKWEVKEAIEWVTKPAECEPSWTKKPTFPDEDMHFQMGYATISKLENLIFYFNNTAVTPVLTFHFFPLHCHNRVIFKQLLQAKALSYLQTDSCSLGRVNENLSVLLMAKRFQSKALQNAAAMRKSSSPHPSSHSD